jgi:hypothetical protein
MKHLSATFVLAVVLAAIPAAKPTFTSTWKSPNAQSIALAGQKVVGLVISDDMDLRMSTEEALARHMTDKGVEGIAAFRLIPREEIRDPERVKAWFQKAGAAGVVIMRLVDLRNESAPSPFVWQSGAPHNSLWNYYPYVWGSTFDIIPSRSETRIVVETSLYDVANTQLLWAGTSESTNPEGAQALVKEIVDGAADQMEKDGLIRRK